MFDYLIVGAGFAGSVLAERLAQGSNMRVLIWDRRPHIGGNASWGVPDLPTNPAHRDYVRSLYGLVTAARVAKALPQRLAEATRGKRKSVAMDVDPEV